MAKSIYECNNPKCVSYKIGMVKDENPSEMVLCGYCGLTLTWVKPYDVQSKFE